MTNRVFIGCIAMYLMEVLFVRWSFFSIQPPKSDIETKHALLEKERQLLPMCIFLGLYPFSKEEPMLCTRQGHKIYPVLAEVCWSAIAHLRDSSRIRYLGNDNLTRSWIDMKNYRNSSNDMGVSENSGFSPQIIHLLIEFSIIFTIHFGVPLFLEFHPYITNIPYRIV